MRTWTVAEPVNPFRPWDGERTLATGVTKAEADRLLRRHPHAHARPEPQR